MEKIRILLLIIFISVPLSLSAEPELKIGVLNNQGESEIGAKEIIGSQVQAVMVNFIFKPSEIQKYNKVEIRVKRTSWVRSAVYSAEPGYLIDDSIVMKSKKGHHNFPLYLFNAKNGKTAFYDEIMERKPTIGYFLGKKGTEYRNEKEVDSYILEISARGLRKIGEEKVFDNFKNTWVKVPKYDNGVLIVKENFKVITTDKFSPQEKSSNLGDEQDGRDYFLNQPGVKIHD